MRGFLARKMRKRTKKAIAEIKTGMKVESKLDTEFDFPVLVLGPAFGDCVRNVSEALRLGKQAGLVPQSADRGFLVTYHGARKLSGRIESKMSFNC